MIGSIEWYECFCGELCPFWCGFCEAAKSGVKLTEELSEADENDELVWFMIDLVKWLGFSELECLEDLGVLGGEFNEVID